MLVFDEGTAVRQAERRALRIGNDRDAQVFPRIQRTAEDATPTLPEHLGRLVHVGNDDVADPLRDGRFSFAATEGGDASDLSSVMTGDRVARIDAFTLLERPAEQRAIEGARCRGIVGHQVVPANAPGTSSGWLRERRLE